MKGKEVYQNPIITSLIEGAHQIHTTVEVDLSVIIKNGVDKEGTSLPRPYSPKRNKYDPRLPKAVANLNGIERRRR